MKQSSVCANSAEIAVKLNQIELKCTIKLLFCSYNVKYKSVTFCVFPQKVFKGLKFKINFPTTGQNIKVTSAKGLLLNYVYTICGGKGLSLFLSLGVRVWATRCNERAGGGLKVQKFVLHNV